MLPRTDVLSYAVKRRKQEFPKTLARKKKPSRRSSRSHPEPFYPFMARADAGH